MKYVKYIFWLVLLVGGAYFGIAMMSKVTKESWPAFEQVEQAEQPPLTPVVVAQADRDFGWRIGDHVPVTVYVKQKPGTFVDIYSFAYEGDFALVGVPTFKVKDFEDGTRFIEVKMVLQSMSVNDTMSFKGFMLYRDLETNLDHLFSFPEVAVSRSNTWDGQDIVKVGDTSIDTYSIMVNSLILAFGGALGVIALLLLNRRLKKKFFIVDLPKDFDARRKEARKKFDKAWAHIEDGNYTIEGYREVAKIIRDLFHLQTAGFREVSLILGEAHVYRKEILKMLMLLGEPMYRNRKLTAEEHYSVKRIFDEIVPPEDFGNEARSEVSES